MPVSGGAMRRRKERERGQVLVLVALFIPVLMVVGSIVIDVGNWYVLKRHLQTQVDAAALAGGPAFTGCFQNPSLATAAIEQQALGYAGDPTRNPATHNPLMEDTADVHAVLNSSAYWADGDPPDGSMHDWTIGTPGTPCETKFLDVKATDDGAPLLWKWLPFFPDLKTRARVEISQIESTNGLKPLGVPEVDPEQIAVLIVDEDGDPNSPASIVGKSLLDPQSTPPFGLDAMSVWSKDNIAPVDVSGDVDYGVIVVSSRSTTPIALNGSLSQICSPASGQVECYGGTTPSSGISFIHAYSNAGAGTAGAPRIRGVTLDGGCTPDLSRPYFNFEGGCPLTIFATIDFGTGASDPSDPPAQGGVCANVSSSPGPPAGLTWAGGAWTGSFTPGTASGFNRVDLSWSTDVQGNPNNCSGSDVEGDFDEVAKPYVSDDASGPVEYLRVELAGGAGLANSIVQSSTASLKVTVGLTPPLREGQLSEPPIVLRGWVQPSQSQALDCGTGSSGWGEAMENGCADAFQIYDQAKHTTKCGPPPNGVPPADPVDCIESQNGNFQEKRVEDMLTPCSDHPNRWDGMTIPPEWDKRWMPLFVLDQMAFDISGKRTYPIRRFGMFYVTAVSGMNCIGDVPATVASGKREMWGHFLSFITPGFGETIPSDTPCSFGNGVLCVSNLVE
jgi:Putative Flp pilus-assembly TadE/G-like